MGKPKFGGKPKGRGKANNVIAKLQKDVAVLKKEVAHEKPEAKMLDVIFDSQHSLGVPNTNSLTTGTNRFALCIQGQGPGPNQRVGDKIRIMAIRLRYQVYIPFGTFPGGDLTNLFRVIIVHDKAFASTAPTSMGLLLQGLGDVIAQKQQGATDRFKFIYDRTHSLNYNGNTSVFVDKVIKLNNILQYNGVAGTEADLANDNYYLVFATDSYGSPNPRITFHNRIIYEDA